MADRASEPPALARVRARVLAGSKLWLFLDYDGTLVPIAPTPAEARPDASLLELLACLAARRQFRVVVLSGRPLGSLLEMLPVPALILAGTYGLEVQLWGTRVEAQAGLAALRPTVEAVKAKWAELVGSRAGFLVEDKGLAVALHARWAPPDDAGWVLPRARRAAEPLTTAAPVRILGGDRFLEVAPVAAHKGQAVEWLLRRLPWPGAGIVYFGDDDKDEEAYAVVRQWGGTPIAVGPRLHRAATLGWLPAPGAVCAWLQQLAGASPPDAA
jgi:trehalose 6-phosphate phosphatase